MKKAFLVAAVIVLFLSMPLAAETVKSKTFPLSSKLYSLMDDLYSLQGFSRPSTSRPWSQSEASLILSRIKREKLSGEEISVYDKIAGIINENLRWNFKGFSMGLKADLAFEAYIHRNTEDFVKDSNWLRGFERRKPLAKASMDFAISDFFYTYCDLQYGYGRVTRKDSFVSLNPDYSGPYKYVTSDGYIGSYYMDKGAHMMIYSAQYGARSATNLIKDSSLFDFDWPKRAVFSLGGDKWNVQYGRDRLEIGNSAFGNMLVDNHTDFEDYFSLTVFSDSFKYQWLNIFLNGISTFGEDPTNDFRIYMIHTLEFRPFENFSFIISENVMYRIASDGKNRQVLDFAYLNPSFIFHNLNNRAMFNAIAYAEVNWAPAKRVELYGQFALDQARAPNESSDQSSSWGFTAGSKYTRAIGDGIARFYAEFAYTTPLFYRRDIVDFVKMSRYFHIDTEDQLQPDGIHSSRFGSYSLIFEFIGFPYGGDCEAFKLGASYTVLDFMSVKVYGRLLQHGEFNLFTPHNYDGSGNPGGNSGLANYEGVTPSGTKWLRAVFLSSNVEFDMKRIFGWPSVTLEAELDWIGKWNYSSDTGIYSNKRTDTQFTIAINVSI